MVHVWRLIQDCVHAISYLYCPIDLLSEAIGEERKTFYPPSFPTFVFINSLFVHGSFMFSLQSSKMKQKRNEAMNCFEKLEK